MKKPARRVTLLGWLTIILLIALGSAAWIDQGRRIIYLRLAESHRVEMERFDRDSQTCGAFAMLFARKESDRRVIPSLNPSGDATVFLRKQAAFHRKAEHESAMSRKYREAAAQPWLGVEPDPPSP